MDLLQQKNDQTTEADEATPPPEKKKQKKPLSPKMKQFVQILQFTGFSISAGIIQFVTTGALSTWTNLIPYWIGYLIGLVLSVVWNFTFNRKFTFRAANNVPLAMSLVVLYYCAFTPVSTFGADAIVDSWKLSAGEFWIDDYEMVITASMMILNFITEFLWDKFVVFNAKVTDKIEALFKKKSAAGTELTKLSDEEFHDSDLTLIEVENSENVKLLQDSSQSDTPQESLTIEAPETNSIEQKNDPSE